jgi:hypothetical protein
MAFNKGFKTILEFVKLGFNVHLDSLGYVRVTLRSRGMELPEKVTADTVTDIVPHFVFSEAFRAELKREKLERKSEG